MAGGEREAGKNAHSGRESKGPRRQLCYGRRLTLSLRAVRGTNCEWTAEAWAAPVPRITRQQYPAACSRSARTCASLCAPDVLRWPRGLRGHTLAASAPLKHWRVPLTATFPMSCPLIPARGLTVGKRLRGAKQWGVRGAFSKGSRSCRG